MEARSHLNVPLKNWVLGRTDLPVRSPPIVQTRKDIGRVWGGLVAQASRLHLFRSRRDACATLWFAPFRRLSPASACSPRAARSRAHKPPRPGLALAAARAATKPRRFPSTP